MIADIKNIKNLAADLEKQELDALGGTASAQVYAQLLAAYLYQNDLCNAKYLWKRIPQNIKTSHAELATIWKVGQKMWQRDFPGMYAALRVDWSENVAQIMQALLVSVQERAASLVSHAYSSIGVDSLGAMLGLPAEEAARVAVEKGWQVDRASRTVMPARPPPPADDAMCNEDQLYKLTDFVSFLEN
ncbi:COP9 signalosome complex subunit 8 [Bacillus rossius redtenbacheri]|uniref:COP9 signalosome complex subunit 8 n=1 Tax=Bacillus rossius redtenbacheri TaxID=93214 RepID=UPI002FDD8886